MILKCVSTGRLWGDRRDETASRLKIGGVDCVVREFDCWAGPLEAGSAGQYHRYTSIDTAGPVRRDDLEGATT